MELKIISAVSEVSGETAIANALSKLGAYAEKGAKILILSVECSEEPAGIFAASVTIALMPSEQIRGCDIEEEDDHARKRNRHKAAQGRGLEHGDEDAAYEIIRMMLKPGWKPDMSRAVIERDFLSASHTDEVTDSPSPVPETSGIQDVPEA